METIQTNQSQWIASALNREHNSVVIDKLVKYDNEGRTHMLTDPVEIADEATNTFNRQFRKHNTKLQSMSTMWQNIYKRNTQNSEHLKSLSSPITVEEWNSMVRQLNMESAAGPSAIQYKMVKKFSYETNQFIITFINLTLELGIIPAGWKCSNIYPIPKPHKFNYEMVNTRPIALLDVIRKCATKIITSRISNALSEHQILEGLNFCGLKGEDTTTPLMTMNNIIEDAKANNKELWIMTQDMAKAFDSISMESLEMSLNRIGIPTTLKTWIINLYRNRSMRIITSYGLTKPFTAGDGVDQGDALSPLLWRIFYDPMLVAVQSQNDRDPGYHMSCTWPDNVNDPTTWTQYETSVPIMCYMDDTVFMDQN